MSNPAPKPNVLPAPCPRCTGPGDAHYLTCPTLRLPRVRIQGLLAAVATQAAAIERTAARMAVAAVPP